MNRRAVAEVARRRALESARAERLQRWAEGAQPGPFKLTHYPTDACNMQCAVCWQRKGVPKRAELSGDRQVAIIEEACALGVRELVVGGGGEPLVRWSTIERLAWIAEAASMYRLMFTNGTLISPSIAATLADSGWHKVLISIDGLQTINDEVRQKGAFEAALRGLDHVVAARRPRDLPVVGVGCVLTTLVLRQLPDLICMLGNRGCDQLNLIRLGVHLPEQRRFALTERDLEALPKIVEDALSVAESVGMVTNLREYTDTSVLRQLESFDSVLEQDAPPAPGGFWDSLCFEPFSNMVIHANGDVGPCCMSGDDPLASIHDRSLEDIWYGEEFQRLREDLRERRPASFCRSCDLNVYRENQRLRNAGTRGSS